MRRCARRFVRGLWKPQLVALRPSRGYEANQGVQMRVAPRPGHVDLDKRRSLPRLDARRRTKMSSVQIATTSLTARYANESNREACVIYASTECVKRTTLQSRALRSGRRENHDDMRGVEQS